MDRLKTRLKILQHPASRPVFLLAICVLAYGTFLPWMGFYWDDWPWIWRYHVYGDAGIRAIDIAFRPLAGIVLWLGAQLAGENPLGWQIYNLILRWLGGWALWWALGQIWPRQKRLAFWASLLFITYPGFSQQFVAINSSRHLFPLITFFASLGWMAQALRSPQQARWRPSLALALMLVTLFTTEYYYGLELLRAAVIWVLMPTQSGPIWPKLRQTGRAWLPYLLILLAVFIWRYTISQNVNYDIDLDNQLMTNPLTTLWQLAATAGSDLVEATWSAYAKALHFPNPAVFGPRKTILFWGLSGLAGLLTLGVTSQPPSKQHTEKAIRNQGSREPDAGQPPRPSLQAALIGLSAIFIGGLPFWVSGLGIKLAFPNDRLTLPLSAGVALLVAAALTGLRKPAWLGRALLSLMVGLSVGVQVRHAADYQSDWQHQIAFFEQLTWRIPGLQPGTVILAPELPFAFNTDNSLTPTLNWVYNPAYPQTERVQFFDVELRLREDFSNLAARILASLQTDTTRQTQAAPAYLALYPVAGGCLRILDPQYDRYLPGVPDFMDEAATLVNLDSILVDSPPSMGLPAPMGAAEAPVNWCYYFQKADLARQQGQWDEVTRLGDLAFQAGDSPNHASERVPFIEAYAYTGNWEKAVGLTLEAQKINKFMTPMLCDTWQRIAAKAAESPEKNEQMARIQNQLECQFSR